MALPNGFIDSGIRRTVSASGACMMPWYNGNLTTSLLDYGVFFRNQSALTCGANSGVGFYAAGPIELMPTLPFG